LILSFAGSRAGLGFGGRGAGGFRRPLKPPRLARHLARAPSPGPPSPEAGVARRPATQGRLARRRRPALRGALRLVGFATDGTRRRTSQPVENGRGETRSRSRGELASWRRRERRRELGGRAWGER